MKLALCLLVLISATVPVQSQTPTPRLNSVQKIFVGSMGQSDEAERFRILLGGELTKVGFTVVDNEAKADATLTGILTVRVYADESIARATVSLTSSDDVRLWAKDFEPHAHFGGNDTVKLRAQDVAKELRKEWKRK